MKTFNWKVYIDKYTDLKNNLKKAWKHWICFGKFEGRTCFLEPEIIVTETEVVEPEVKVKPEVEVEPENEVV